jgi:hypothetical protein
MKEIVISLLWFVSVMFSVFLFGNSTAWEILVIFFMISILLSIFWGLKYSIHFFISHENWRTTIVFVTIILTLIHTVFFLEVDLKYLFFFIDIPIIFCPILYISNSILFFVLPNNRQYYIAQMLAFISLVVCLISIATTVSSI